MSTSARQDFIDALSLLAALKPHVDPNDNRPERAPFNAAWDLARKQASEAAETYVKAQQGLSAMAPAESHVLAREVATYEREKANLLANHPGMYVLIKGEEILGIYQSQAFGLILGLSRFPNQPFFLHRIDAEEPISYCYLAT